MPQKDFFSEFEVAKPTEEKDDFFSQFETAPSIKPTKLKVPEVEASPIDTEETPVSNVTKPTETTSLFKRAWHAVSDPLTDAPSRLGKSVGDYITTPHLDENPIITALKGFAGGAAQGLGDVSSGMTSPLNIATALLGGTEYAAGKAGLSKLAQLANIGTKVASAPMVAHGGVQVVNPESSIGERGFGLAEIAGGLAGLKGHAPEISSTTPDLLKPPIKLNEPIKSTKPVDPNFNAGLGDAELAGSTPYKRTASNDADFNAYQERLNKLREHAKGNDIIPNELDEITTKLEKDLKPAQLEVVNDEHGIQSTSAGDEDFFKQFETKDLPQVIGDESTAIAKRLPEGLEPKTLNSVTKLDPEAEIHYSADGNSVAIKSKKGATPENMGRSDVERGLIGTKGLQEKFPAMGVDPTGEWFILAKDGDSFNSHLDELPIQTQVGGNQPPPPIDITPVSQPNSPQPLNPKTQALLVKRSQPEQTSTLQNIYDLPRGMMSVDPPFITSAAFRQAGPLVGTKEWFKSWGSAAKAYGDRGAYEKMMTDIESRPLFKTSTTPEGKPIPSYAQEVGLKLTDLKSWTKREEALKGELAEKIPIYGRAVAASNRSYTAFLNNLRTSRFEALIDGAKNAGLDPTTDLNLGKQIASFINDATGRGDLKLKLGRDREINLEQHTKLLSNLLFSPRGIASKVAMLNPATYIMANPYVRKQYMTSMLRQMATWWSIAGIAQYAGAKVSKDPNSSDFGKIKIGNTRIDVPGGLQQYLVLGNRMLPQKLGGGGISSSNTGKFTPFGKGFKAETRGSTLAQFGLNRTHPTLKYAIDLFSATNKQPVGVMDRTAQLAVPMFADDLADIIKEQPELAPIVLGLSGAGMGTQTYEKGSFGDSKFIPKTSDFLVGK